MKGITTPDELQEWLQDKPLNWAQVMAHRTALRVVPILDIAMIQSNFRDDLKLQLFLSVFRASIISEVAVCSLTSEISFAAIDAVHSVDTCIDTTNVNHATNVTFATHALYVAHAAADVADAVRATHISAHAAARAFAHATRAIDFTDDIVLNQDVNWLKTRGSSKGSVLNLLSIPLWQNQENPLENNWQSLQQALISVNLNWQFWMDWYQAKLNGTLHPSLTQSQQEDLYYQIATFPNELWEEGAEAVNHRIAELMEEIKESKSTETDETSEELIDLDLPPQNSAALRFKTNEEGKVQLAPASEYDKVLTDEGAKARHEEAREFAQELLQLFDPNKPGANAVAPLIEKTQRCLDALGQTPEVVDIDRLIPRGEALRQLAIKEENRDDYSDSPPLPDGFKEALNNFLAAYNPYIALDPVLDKRDQIRLGPDEKGHIITTDEGQAVIDDLADADLLEQGTKDILDEVTQNAEGSVGPDSRTSIYYSESLKNLGRYILAEVDKAFKSLKKTGKVASEVCFDGAVVGAVMIHQDFAKKRAQIILKHEKWFVKNFGRTPTMKTMMVGFIHRIKTNPLLTDDED